MIPAAGTICPEDRAPVTRTSPAACITLTKSDIIPQSIPASSTKIEFLIVISSNRNHCIDRPETCSCACIRQLVNYLYCIYICTYIFHRSSIHTSRCYSMDKVTPWSFVSLLYLTFRNVKPFRNIFYHIFIENWNI